MKIKSLVLALFLMIPLTAFAGECDTDEDCPDGSFCIFGPTEACACIPCAEGEECPPCDCPEQGQAEGFCESYEIDFGEIVAGECSEDGGCPMDFACQEVTLPCDPYPSCPPCACMGCDPDDEDCTGEDDCECPPCDEPEPCEEETGMFCVYSPTECETDDECGDGFECLAIEECMGGGSSGGGCACPDCVCETCPEGEDCEECECPPCDCADDEWEEPETWEECYTLASICFPVEQECQEDADCAEDFLCVESDSNMTTCACPACDCAPCPPGEECESCECPPCDCGEEEDPDMFCVPNGWEDAEYLGGGGSALSSAEEAWDLDGGGEGGGSETPKSPNPEDDTNSDTTSGEQGANADEGGSESSGCSAGGQGSAASAFLLLAMLLGLALRRRSSLISL